MLDNSLSDVVSNQYEKWIYPEPIMDLPAWLATNWQWFDPKHASSIFWPDRAYFPQMDILVAGCGTNQAAVIAYTNPEAKIVAIDVSESSLNHHRYLKKRYGLENLELQQFPIENLPQLKRSFDLIISTGVLHHLADPQKGLDALSQCLKKDGVIAIMLYARYGRMGLEMIQSVFRDMKFEQTDQSIAMVKEALSVLPKDHPIQSYISLAPDLQYDAGLVDTFLHGRERSYTIDDCVDFVEASGLVFQDLLFKAPYYPRSVSNNSFISALAKLPDQQQWSIMERMNFRNSCHFFIACRADRTPKSYKIDFNSEQALKYVPVFRFKCGVNGNKIRRHDWEISLRPHEAALANLIDGQLSVQHIIEKAQSSISSDQIKGNLQDFAIEVFRSLWKLDFIAIQLPRVKKAKG